MAIGNGIGVRWGRVSLSSASSPDFIMEVDTRIVGATPDNQFVVATQGAEVFQGNDFNVKTSDGQEFNNITANSLTITFPSPGIYTIKISGKFSGTRYGISNDGKKIIDIKNWGDWEALQWARARDSFRECDNLTTFSASDAPYLGGLDSQGLNTMFWNCDNLNADFSKWDVGSIENFDSMFGYCGVFNNSSLNNWDMSSATRISYMFQEANAFNQDLSAWDVSNVTDMRGVFDNADAFNGDVSTWNTSSVTGSLYRLFSRTSFNGDLSNWDVSGVTALDNTFAFSPFNNDSIGNWDVSNVSNWRSTFSGATLFNGDISGWDVSSATRFENTFGNAIAFNQPIGNWDVSNVQQMDNTFYAARSFNQDLSGWDVSGVTNMLGMFNGLGTELKTLNIGGWNTANVENMQGMLAGSRITDDLSGWDVSSCTNFQTLIPYGKIFFDLSPWAIQGAVNLNNMIRDTYTDQNIIDQWDFSGWDISQCTTLGTQFALLETLKTDNYDNTLISWAGQAPVNALTAHFGFSKYTAGSAAETARDTLINTYGWTIIDGGGIVVPFTFTVQTDNAGTSAANQFTIPITSATPYDIETSDGQTITGAAGATTLTFPSAGTYTINITGSCIGWRFDNGGDRLKMLNISNWGVYANSTYGAFNGCSNMTCSATDKPIGIHTRMTRAFNGCVNFNGAIGNWDVSNVTLMNGAFGLTPFNQDLSNWDVSNVTDMSTMFINATSFNQNINSWNVSSVTDMNNMFNGATSFNSELYSWDVSSVQRMDYMFSSATSFNQDISAWDISSSNMGRMFYQASSFNQPLNSWNVSGVTNMQEMFLSTPFNQPLNSWDVSNVTNMAGMFRGTVFDQDISSWNVSNVSNFLSFMRGHGAPYVNLDMSGWVFRSAGVDLEEMFVYPGAGAIGSAWPKGLDTWTTTGAIDMHLMFGGSKLIGPLDVSGWDTSSVTRISNMFWNYGGSYAFTLTGLSNWNISSLTTAAAFLGNSFNALSTAEYDALLVAWEAQAPSNAVNIHFGNSQYTLGSAAETARTSLINTYGWTITDGGGIAVPMIITVDTTLGDGLDNYTLNFTGTGYDIETSDGQTITGATTATTINFPGPGTYDIEISGDVSTRSFASDLKLIDIKKWGSIDTPLDDKFSGANSLTTITAPDQPVNLNMTRLFKNAQNFAGGISHWDVSNITSFQNAFSNTSFNEDISSWDMSSANTLREMFNYTPFNNGGQPGIGNWDVSNVTNFQGCFTGTPFNQPIGSWTIKTSGPVLMGSMFSQATSFNQDLNAWDVSGVTTMTRMFNVASSFNGDVSNWDVSGVADLGYMFERASSFNHPGIGSWNTSGATSMAGMFDGVNLGMAFNQDISGWDVSNVLQMNNMFRNCYSLDQPFNSWNTSSLQNMSQVFFNCISFNQPLNLWNTSNVTQMQNVFYGASSFNQPLGDWDTSNVINMIGTFRGASSFNQALNLWNTSVVGNMTSMFYGATSFNQDLSTWNTSNVTSLGNTFELTTASSFGIANWNTSNVNNFNATFRNNTSFNEDVSGWDITGCTGSFNDTFSGCQSFNQPIGNWNITSAVTRLSNLLRGAISFDQDLSSWNISGVTLFNSFAQGVTLSTANYDALLVAWESQAPVFSGAISFGNSQYTLGSAAETARTSLINTYGWTITDGGGI